MIKLKLTKEQMFHIFLALQGYSRDQKFRYADLKSDKAKKEMSEIQEIEALILPNIIDINGDFI